MANNKRKSVGETGEQLACLFLERKGFSILERNYRKSWGEIDIIAAKKNVVHFVEVKAISVSDFSREMGYRPEEMVHNSKLKKLSKTASLYMEGREDEREFQIDVVGVLINHSTRVARCRFFEQVL